MPEMAAHAILMCVWNMITEALLSGFRA